MLTKWGQRLASVRLTNKSNQMSLPPVSIANNSKTFIEAKTLGGITKYINPYIYCNPTFIINALVQSGSSASYGVAFGSGNTPSTENDYTLESQITGIAVSLQGGNIQTLIDEEQNKYVSRFGLNITNNNENSIVIREIGLFCKTYPSDTLGDVPTTTNTNYYSFMIDRTVLDTPVTIAPDETGTVYYDFAY